MDLPKRKNIRLKNYNYSDGGSYFITICAYKHKKIFSDIVGSIHESTEIKLNENGIIIDYYINKLNNRFNLTIDKYVIMPDHVHLLVTIKDTRAIRESPLQYRSLISKAIGYLKMNSSREIHKNGFFENIWQSRYYDHIIRNQNDYNETWEYIENNPKKWVLMHNKKS